MLRGAVVGVLIRPLFSRAIKVGLEKGIVKRGSTICNLRCLVPGYKSLQEIGLHNQARQYHAEKKHSIKFLSCGELTGDNVGDHVELHGKISFTEGKQLILSDQSGSVRLTLNKNAKRNQMNILKSDSVVKLTGVVIQKKKMEDYIGSNEFSCAVLVTNIISVSPLTKNPSCKTKDNLNLELLPEELSRCSPSSMHYFFRRSHNCAELNKAMVGEDVKLCGWVRSIDGENIFTLEDGYGSVSVNYAEEVENLISTAEDIDVNDLIFLEGVISPMPESFNYIDQNKPAVQVSVKKLSVIKDSSPESSQNLELVGDSLKKHPSDNKEKNDECVAGEVESKKEKDSLPDFNRYTLRSHNCGEINEGFVGQTVDLMGWALYIRMNKFILLSDKYGTIQLYIPDSRKDLQKLLETLSPESVISVTGTVSSRPPGQENKFMKSGVLEVCVKDMKIISKASPLPVNSKSSNPSRHVLSKYRYLDLRRSMNLKRSLQMRCDVLHKMRKFLVENVGFLEVETPTLFRRTPGGAQEFIVPTRTKGEFYSLVQSPQQFKQLLMVGGIDRYFQIARCYRDETGQRDRQPEFTQLDIEMSFCNREGVINLIEDLIKYIWPHDSHHLVTPFPRLTYEEAMTTYGSDKPDTRFGCEISELTEVFRSAGEDIKVDFKSYLDLSDFAAHAFIVRNGMAFYSMIKNLIRKKEDVNFHLFAFEVVEGENIYKILARLFGKSVSQDIRRCIEFEIGDVIVLGLGPKMDVLKALGDIRVATTYVFDGRDDNVIDKDGFRFAWILDFPLFELVDGRIKSVHHPFTQPHPDDVHMLDTEPLKVRSLHYDLVLNGSEIGGGSIRIHDAALQKTILRNFLGLNVSSLEHLLQALDSGAPIHGGFAIGIDRFIALLCRLSYINEVIAFPKSSSGRDTMSGAPCSISDEEKALYHIN